MNIKRFLALTLCLLLTVTLCLGQVGCTIEDEGEQVFIDEFGNVIDPNDMPDNDEDSDATTTTGGADSDDPAGEDDPADPTKGEDGKTTTTKGGKTTTTKGGQGGKNTTTTKGGQTAQNVEPNLKGTKMEFECFTNESDSSSEAWTDVIDAFEKATGVKVTAYIGSTVVTQLAKRWLGGNPPDVALLSGAGFNDVALEKSGHLYDFTDMLENGYVYGTQEKIKDVINPALHESADNGKIYRAGILGTAYGMFYDSNYMKTLGVEAPSTYKELVSFTKKVTSQGKHVYTTYGTSGSYSLWAMVLSAAACYGQDFVTQLCNGEGKAWKSAEMKQILQRWNDFCTGKGDFAGLKTSVLTPSTPSWDHTTSQKNWLNHEAAIIGNGIWLPWEMELFTPKDFKMEFKTSPLTPDGKTPTVLMYPQTMVIAEKAKNKTAAEAFVRFLFTKKAQEVLGGAYAYAPGRTDLDYSNLPLSGTSAEASSRILGYIGSGKVKLTYRSCGWGDLNNDLCKGARDLMIGDTTVDKFLKSVKFF